MNKKITPLIIILLLFFMNIPLFFNSEPVKGAIFGNTVANGSYKQIGKMIRGTVFTCPSNCIAESLTMYVDAYVNPYNITGGIYLNSTKALVGQTENRNITVSHTWRTFWFTNGSEPVLTAGTEYILIGCSENPHSGSDYATIRTDTTTGIAFYGSYDMGANNGILEDPFTPDASETGNCNIYCVYTSTDSPEIVDPDPSDGASVPLTLSSWSCYISDPNGDSFNWSIETSPDVGNSNADNENNGTKTCSISGLSYSITYTVYVNATDGLSSANETYTFKTETVYYMSNTGMDSNDGLTPATPWQNKTKLNTELDGGVIEDGNNIYFKRGDTFDDDVTIFLRSIDGTSTDPMLFGAYGTGADPVISTTDDTALFNNLNSNTGHWIFENITFRDDYVGGGSIDAMGFPDYTCNNLTIRNCTFDTNDYGANSNYMRILLKKFTDVTIENCILNDTAIVIGVDCYNTKIENIIIDGKGGQQDNYAIHFDGTDYSSKCGKNHAIINVTSHSSTVNAFDIVCGVNSSDVYMYNCKGYDTGEPPLVIGHGSENVTIDSCIFYGGTNALYLTKQNNTIIRNCVFKNNGNNDVMAQDDPQWITGMGTENIMIYNNDFISNGDDGFIAVNAGDQSNIYLQNFYLKNNIFYSLKDSSPNTFVYYLPTGAGIWNLATTHSNYTNNMWWRGDGNLEDNRFVLEDGSYNITGWNLLDEVYNDMKDNASINNPDGTVLNDFILNSNSPCINNGYWLTATVGGGTGTTITVDEANFFLPGINELSISGDNIFIGDDTDLQITAVDYNAETITVNRSITWVDGENVSLSSFNGSKIDIGALEYSSTANIAPIISNPLPNDDAINQTLNPNLQVTITDPNGDTMNLTFRTNASGTWQSIGWHNNTNNGTKSNTTSVFTSWNTKYYWSANLTDGTVWDNNSYSFTTKENFSTVFSNPGVVNNSVDIPITTASWNITINDPEGDTFNWTIETSPDIGSNSSNSDINGSKTVDILGNLSYSNSYIVYVNATDTGSGLWTREWFNFTVEDNNPPTISMVYPGNNSKYIEISPICYVVVSDPDADLMNISFYEYTNSTWLLNQTNSSVGNGTYYWNYVNASVYNTRYYWNVSVFDGTDYLNNTYSFVIEPITPATGGGGGGITIIDDEDNEKKDGNKKTDYTDYWPFFVIFLAVFFIILFLFIIIKR